jgi:GTP-binding protein
MPDILKTTPVIAIVGRTNVGKSTLFNRLLGRRKAIVSDIPGTTQDINFGHCLWRDATYTVIDTAGLDLSAKNEGEKMIRRQAEMAMAKADVILLLTDTKAGPLIEDRAFAKLLQKSKKKVYLVANKADNPAARREAEGGEWMKLGLGAPHPISAANGSGVGDLLDELAAYFKEHGRGVTLPPVDARVAIIGRPNVGKSSLLNALAGEERVIVSEIAHTTREPQDTLLTFTDDQGAEKRLLLVDTVGIRKRTHVAPGIEKLGVRLSLDMLKTCDIGLLIVDAVDGVSIQEKKLAGIITEENKALIIIINKWDAAQEAGTDGAEYLAYIRQEFPFCPWAPVVLISAKSGRSVAKLPGLALAAVAAWRREVPQEQLDFFMEKIKKQHHAVSERGYWKRRPKIYGMSQDAVSPPRFTVTVNDKAKLSSGLMGFIENRLRDDFDFDGTAIYVGGRELKKR